MFLPATPEELRVARLGEARRDPGHGGQLHRQPLRRRLRHRTMAPAGRVPRGDHRPAGRRLGGGHHPPRRTGPLLGRDGRLHRLAGRQPHRLGKAAPGGRLHGRGDQLPPPRPGGDRLRQPDPTPFQSDQTDRPGGRRGEPPADRPLRRLVEPGPPLRPDRRQGRPARLRDGGADRPGDRRRAPGRDAP